MYKIPPANVINWEKTEYFALILKPNQRPLFSPLLFISLEVLDHQSGKKGEGMCPSYFPLLKQNT